MNFIENNINQEILIDNEEETFTFGPKDFLQNKTLNNPLNDNNSKKKYLIRIPILKKTDIVLKKNHFNSYLLKEKLNLIENELNNISLDNEEENNSNLYDLKNIIKKEKKDILQIKEKKKFSLKEKYDILCFFINDAKNLINLIYRKDDFQNLYYINKLNEKTNQIILIIERIFKNMQYLNKIYPIERIYNLISFKYNIQNYSFIELKLLKNELKKEYLNCKGKVFLFDKLIRIISCYFDKIKRNVKSQLRIIEIYKLINSKKLYNN